MKRSRQSCSCCYELLSSVCLQSFITQSAGIYRVFPHDHIDGLVQERRNSNALAMELCFSCTIPSKERCNSIAWAMELCLASTNLLIWWHRNNICIKWYFVKGIHWSSADFPHKEPVIWTLHISRPIYMRVCDCIVQFYLQMYSMHIYRINDFWLWLWLIDETVIFVALVSISEGCKLGIRLLHSWYLSS